MYSVQSTIYKNEQVDSEVAKSRMSVRGLSVNSVFFFSQLLSTRPLPSIFRASVANSERDISIRLLTAVESALMMSVQV
jgi:hypothetical protein